MTKEEFNPALLKIRLISHGLKTDIDKMGDPILPRADFYIDCRGIQEEGLSGTGHHQEFQEGVEAQSSYTLKRMEELIWDSLDKITTRRKSEDPYKRPYVVCFMCAWGLHRSVSTKYIIYKRLLAKGLQVAMVD